MSEVGLTLADWEYWWTEGCTRLPVARVCENAVRPASWAGLAGGAATVLLESAQAGRYTYVCDRPARVIVGQREQAEIWTGEPMRRAGTRVGAPLDVLAALHAEAKAPDLPGWPAMSGGWIGVCGYDLVHTWERLPWRAQRDLGVPLYAFLETRELFVYDHHERKLWVIVWSEVMDADELGGAFARAEAAAKAAEERWREHVDERRGPNTPRPAGIPLKRGSAGTQAGGREQRWCVPAPSFSPAAWEAAVRRVLDYIAAGDTYQVNLSLRTSRATEASPLEIYEALRRVNPSPYMGLLRLPEFALVCGSPELLVRLVDGVVSSRPIAGTRPRGDATRTDAHFSAELLASEKERAEHLMLVDLIRNDIGRVAAYGSVAVKEFMALEHYSHVMHIVSQVEGRLAAERTWVEVLRAMFPGGTITGCPKVRTMEIIEELEPVGRGFYTGALGWISYGGAMEMNIVIRSMLVQGGVAHVQAGAGIVADSRPEREFDEAQRKARALWVALEAAEAGAAERGDVA